MSSSMQFLSTRSERPAPLHVGQWRLDVPKIDLDGRRRAGRLAAMVFHRRQSPRIGMTTANGSRRGVQALRRSPRLSRSTGRRCARSCTRASVVSACACVCPTPTVRAPGHRLRARGHQRRWRVDFPRDRPGAQVQWITHHHHSRRCVGGERSGVARRAGTRRSRGQSLPAGERGRNHPACAGPANDLHLGCRETSPARAPWRRPPPSPSTS